RVDLALVRAGVISGRVLNLDGSPLANQRVDLLPADSARGWPINLRGGPFTSDSKGDFKLSGVPPGRYLVSVGVDVARLSGEIWDRDDLFGQFGRVVGDQYYAQTFYPGVTNRELAQAITVGGGGRLGGLEWTVGRPYPAYKVSGRVIDARTGQGIPNCGLQV